MKCTFSIASVILLTCLINTGRGAVISDLEPDLVALWHFDEGSGDVTYDSVGAQHGTISGATWIQGKYGSALHFDGSGLVSAGCGCGDITHLLDFTVMAWVNMEANTWFPCVIEKNAGPWTYGGFAPCPEGGWQYGWGLYPNIHSGEELFVTSNKDAWWINARADAIPLNTWTHVAFTCTFVDYKVRDWRIYVNGEEVLLTAANVVGITSQLDGKIYIGDGLIGSIDEIAVFDRVLTPEEIRSCYQDVLEVLIDIKPGSYPNAINLGSQGLIPVAILSSADFDALSVDPSMVSLSGAGVAVRGKASNTMAHEEDVDGDGLLDLVLKIETENLDPDKFQDGWAILTGETFDGQAIEGQDEITIVPAE